MSAAVLLLAAAAVLAGLPRRPGLMFSSQPRPGAQAQDPPDVFATASALDVFAVCLSAGMAVPAAARATAPSAPPPLRGVLERAADLLALGADPDTAWTADGADQSCEPLMRLARRSALSGRALSDGVADLAEQHRRDAEHAATAAGERAGVLVAGPLGLCFLPAFLCVGIAPVVAGLAGDIFGGVLL